jgi:hypothetical protein
LRKSWSRDDRRIFYEPVERDRKKRIEWSRITTSIEKRRRRQRGLALPLLKEDEVDTDDPRRHFHSTSG